MIHFVLCPAPQLENLSFRDFGVFNGSILIYNLSQTSNLFDYNLNGNSGRLEDFLKETCLFDEILIKTTVSTERIANQKFGIANYTNLISVDYSFSTDDFM